MPTLKIPQPLQTYTSGESLLHLKGGSIREMVENLVIEYPLLKPHLINKSGDLNAFVHLFLNGEELAQVTAMDVKLADDDAVILVPSIAGG